MGGINGGFSAILVLKEAVPMEQQTKQQPALTRLILCVVAAAAGGDHTCGEQGREKEIRNGSGQSLEHARDLG